MKTTLYRHLAEVWMVQARHHSSSWKTPAQEGRPEWWTEDLGLLVLIKDFQGDFCTFLSSTCLLRFSLVQQGLRCSGNLVLMQTWYTHCISIILIRPTSRQSHAGHPQVSTNTSSRNLQSPITLMYLHAGKFTKTGQLHRKHWSQEVSGANELCSPIIHYIN